MGTKDLIEYVKECPYCNDVCKEEIIQRLEEHERLTEELNKWDDVKHYFLKKRAK